MKPFFWMASLLLLAGCGGLAVVEQSGGGAGGDTSSVTTSSTTTTNVTTGPGPCSSHDDCPGGVCLFALGVCAPSCSPDTCDACGEGMFCEPCASSSCPKCDDCRAACVPAGPGRCDADDACPAGDVCLWRSGVCAPSCGTDEQCGGFAFCDECATGSCCGCRDCVGACMGGE